MGYPVRLISFPNYESRSSEPVKMYLNGDFGGSEDVNPYAASMLFAVDRFASYKSDWESFYLNGGIIIADRYTTANMVHQSVNFRTALELAGFVSWLEELEYEKMGIPEPDKVIYLDVPIEKSMEIIAGRKNKISECDNHDILESDLFHQARAKESALVVARIKGWDVVNCVHENKMRTIADISSEIFEIVRKII